MIIKHLSDDIFNNIPKNKKQIYVKKHPNKTTE
jgi:hypothetical protein